MKRISKYRICPRERIRWCEILAEDVLNLPWSFCVKTQRTSALRRTERILAGYGGSRRQL
jgi:hypothetical protein